MIRSKKRLWLCSMLLCANLVFIWGNSLLPGEISGAISAWVRNLLAAIFPTKPESPDSGHGLLRKMAHFTEFCSLGMLLFWLFGMLCKGPQKHLVLSFFCGFAAACTDEIIQCFVPDRGPGIKDVGIDSLGVMLGIVIIYFISKKSKSKYLEEQTL